MNDLVSKTEVIKRIKEQYNKHNELIPFWLSIGDIPIVKEQTAEWLSQNGEYVCSECGYEVWGSGISVMNEWKYCPNCGSRMKGDTE